LLLVLLLVVVALLLDRCFAAVSRIGAGVQLLLLLPLLRLMLVLFPLLLPPLLPTTSIQPPLGSGATSCLDAYSYLLGHFLPQAAELCMMPSAIASPHGGCSQFTAVVRATVIVRLASRARQLLTLSVSGPIAGGTECRVPDAASAATPHSIC
jgi:hypothetical protein